LTWDGSLPYNYQPVFFVATGTYGSMAQNADLKFTDRRSFSGKTNAILQANEGMTIGFTFPKDFLLQTPIPPSVMAEKFYFKNQELHITVLKNGVTEVTELYTVVPARRMQSITRYLYPYIAHQQSSFKDWMGDQSRYIISKIEVKGTKKCRTIQSASVCLDISDLPVGEERTIEIKYRTYGNFFESADAPENLLSYAFIPINKGIDEPVLKSSIRIELPDENPDKPVFRSDIYNGENFLRQARIQQLNDRTFHHCKCQI